MARRIWLALIATLSLVAGPASARAAPLIRIEIQPHAMREAVGKGDIDFTMSMPDMNVPAGAPLFSHSFEIADLRLTDAAGAVPMIAPDTKAAGPWRSARAVKGNVVVRYRLAIDNARFAEGGSPVMPRIDGDGLSSMGVMLFLLPPGPKPYRLAVHWNLSAMGAGAEGVSTFGDGDIALPAGPTSRLEHAMFMAGHLKRARQTIDGAFQAVWLGEPEFDPRPAMDWAARLHRWMSGFFHDRSEPPYRVFLRNNPNNPGGGVALGASFAIGYGPGVTGEGLKTILGHEMTHTWTASDTIGKWYNEGDAVYYQALLPWRAGLISTEQYLADLNKTAARYYTNPLKDANDDQIEPKFWSDQNINVLAYDRGAMYFAVLNGMVRRASGGKRSVDDLVRAMVERARAGEPVTEAAWLELLRQDLGEAGPALHRAMMVGGGLMLPQSDDYGPCFQRISSTLRVYDRGFEATKPLTSGARTIKAVEAGSEAAKAGVQVGDLVTYRDSSEGTRRNQTQTLTLHVSRAGHSFDLTYLPRGDSVNAYQWRRVPGVPESACK